MARLGYGKKDQSCHHEVWMHLLKAVEKEWRMLFNEELANLELDLCVRSRRVEW